RYRIDGLPVGKLTIGARHPGVGSESQAPIDVIANVVQSVDFTLTYSPKAQEMAKKARERAVRSIIP
ncbi:MAG: carboxypeptidase-like regulatory domain-containing protein, partial [Polyangiaceae bacterium]